MEDDLYRQYILELYHHPLNVGIIDGADFTIEESNPTCGDELTLMITMNNNIVSKIKHQSHGCAISQAAISLLTEDLKGKTKEELKMYTTTQVREMLGIPISHTRDKCAFLCLRAIQQII